MTRLCAGKIAIVTEAGRGIGREHALSLARHGAKVVVNDLGGARDGTGDSAGDAVSPAQQVVDEIIATGGEAVVNGDNVADWDGATPKPSVKSSGLCSPTPVVEPAWTARPSRSERAEEQTSVTEMHSSQVFAPTPK